MNLSSRRVTINNLVARIYPSVNYRDLNSKSEFFTKFLKIIKEINAIARGGWELDPRLYLIKRDDELEAIISKRLEKFCPKNHLFLAVKFQTLKQGSGSLAIDTQSLPGDPELWTDFLSDVDKRGTGFKAFLINKVFGEALVNKIAYVMVQPPYFGCDFSGMNLAQVESLKTQIEPKPFLTRIDPQTVLSENESAFGSNLEWIKFKRILLAESPYQTTKKSVEFVLCDPVNITTWRYTDVILDDSNEILQIFDTSIGKYRRFDPVNEIASPVTFPHNCGITPVLKFNLDHNLWNVNQTYQCQKIYWGLLCNAIHSAVNSGFIQKWGKRPQDNSGTLTKSVMIEINKALSSNLGDESMFWLDNFAFEEVQGTSVKMQFDVLEDLKNYIYSTIALNQNILDPSSDTSPASGVSKQMDNYFQSSELMNNGSKILSFSTDLLETVAASLDIREGHGSILVTGMDKFTFQPTEDALAVVDKLVRLPKGLNPPLLVKEGMNQVANTLLTNHSHEQRSEIFDEIDKTVSEFYGNSVDENPADTEQPSRQVVPNIDPAILSDQHIVSSRDDAAIAIQ